MKKFGCCLLATLTLLAGAGAATACGGKGGTENGTSSSASSSVQETVWLGLSKKVYNIYTGDTVALQIDFTIDGEAADVSLLTFSSDDPDVATVDESGVVTGLSGGRAYITVSYGNKSTKASINVAARNYAVALENDNVILPIGGTKQAAVTAKLGDDVVQDPVLVWESSNTEVATVENGLITAVGIGSATVTVTYEGVTDTLSVGVVEETTADNVNTFDEAYVNVYGRSYKTGNALNLDHAANAVEVGIIGTSLSVTLQSGTVNSYMRVFVDDETEGEKIPVSLGEKEYVVASGLEEGYHVIRIVKATEEQYASWDIKSFAAEKFFAMPEKSALKIEFIGDSITAGYGMYGTSGESYTVDNSDSAATYAYIAADLLNANYSVVAFSGICTKAYHWTKNINMSTLYGRTSYANTQAYTETEAADVVVVNLGTNEASYMLTSEGASYSEQLPLDYYEFLVTLRETHPDAYIVCLYGMMGEEYAVKNAIQQAIATMDDGKIVYNPFVFVGNTSGANGHPTAAAQKSWGESLATYIKTLQF